MNVIDFLSCLIKGHHRWVHSKLRPGYETCTRCGWRRKQKRWD